MAVKKNGAVSYDGTWCCHDGQPIPNGTILNFDWCPDKVAKPGHVPTANGCGGEGLSSAIPDNPMYTVNASTIAYLTMYGDYNIGNFTPPCDFHDKCYDTCNNPKNYCDATFGDKLDAVCQRDYPGLLNPYLLECYAFSKVYGIVVSYNPKSNESYKNSQGNACNCCF